ncbi:MAG: LacI family transcriptional regulator, partial [Lachnospiraceae bacterium]|nr:LacI family transcriptional regulator [Lachnospiraceae bacterium]
MGEEMTIKEVAELAGVSPAAVSRYLNGGSLSGAKREIIKKTIEETGYRPSVAAQVMRTGRVNQIGVLVPKVNSDSVSQVLAGITSELQSHGYLAVLGSYDSDDEKEISFLQAMETNQAAGVIVMAMDMTPEKKEIYDSLSMPVVVTGQNFKGFSCIYHDDYNAMKQLMKAMMKAGRKHIAYIGALEKDLQAGLARRRGAEAAYTEAGFQKKELITASVGFTPEEGYEATKKILKKYPEIDGVLCASDLIAVGALQAIRESGKKAGDDIG